MTIWVPELDRSKPLYLAIADALAQDVASGVLNKGQRLPPQRDLAWKLGVTLGTITRAYKEAEGRGLLSGEVGRGSYIRQALPLTPALPLGAASDGIVDLSLAVPPGVVQAGEFDAAVSSVMRNPKRLDLLDYAPPEGYPAHRAMAVSWLKRSGIAAQEKDVFITVGAHQGLVTVLESLREPHEKIMAEEINYALLKQFFKNSIVQSLPLAMDYDGLLPDALEKAAARGEARLLYLVPSLQNPTTHTMSRQRREDIVAVARRYNLTIIEDDIFRLLDSRVQPPTFYTLAPERTYHITSLSKTLAPGLRVGFMVSPQGQDRILRAHVRMVSPRNVGMMGEVARFWIESDMASTILARTQHELLRRRQGFMEHFKGAKFLCAPGAPYAWLQLPDWWTGKRFAAAALAQGIRITAGPVFELGQSGLATRHVRICFGAPGGLARSLKAFESLKTLMDHPPEDDFMPVA